MPIHLIVLGEVYRRIRMSHIVRSARVGRVRRTDGRSIASSSQVRSSFAGPCRKLCPDGVDGGTERGCSRFGPLVLGLLNVNMSLQKLRTDPISVRRRRRSTL